MLSTQKVSINGEDSAIKTDSALLVRLVRKTWRQYQGMALVLPWSFACSLEKDEGNSFKSAKSKLQNVLATHEENSFKSVKSKLQNVLEEKMSLVDCVTKLLQSFQWNVYRLTTNKWLEDIWLPLGFCSDILLTILSQTFFSLRINTEMS